MEPVIKDPSTIFSLEGTVAVVTGASSGLGNHFARVLDAAGAKVLVSARRQEAIETLANDLRDGIAVRADLSQPDASERLMDAALDHFGRVDILVNNAGVANVIAGEDELVDDFRRVVEVNLVAPFVLAQRAARAMIASESRGSIINVASILGIVGVGQIPQSSYAASKGGLVNLTRELAAQWARKGVRVNALAPGWFETEMTQEMFDGDAGQRWIRSHTPMGRAGSLDELDGALLFLASSASSYVTGTVLPVDGGWTCV
jgi:NAD(P)-dependent dehydrogenase (short-subunit alcohol dehydrogenase family)